MRERLEHIDQLFDRCTPVTETGCWLFEGAVTTTGYGIIQFSDTLMGAHRAAYLLGRGDIPEGAFVCHTCDVRCCVNPDHLFLASHKENMEDMRRKQRQPNRKLTMADARLVRGWYKEGVSVSVLAQVFNVHRKTVYDILNDVIWQEL
jgi:hypothetical protein